MKRLNYIFLALFSITSFLFLLRMCRFHLVERESMQLFLYTWDYAEETILYRGGVADYISRFIVQFFHFPFLGSAIVSMTLLALQHGVSRFCRSAVYMPISYIPSIIYFALLCDNNYTYTGLFSLTVAIYLVVLIVRIKSVRWKIVSFIVALVAYWFLFCGRFYAYDKAPVLPFVVAWGGTALTIILLSILRAPRRTILPYSILSVFILGGFILSSGFANGLDEEIFKYKAMVRSGDWNKIVESAEEDGLRSPISTNGLNLALAQRGEMGERIFSFFQKGEAGLITHQERGMASEILYWLGFINEAQHLLFEDMATTPDHQRGSYHLLRLAETNLIAGRVDVAHKYLNTLSHTLFYRDRAKELLLLSEEDIYAHPTYGSLRRIQPFEDFRYDGANFEEMLEKMLHQHPDNHLAKAYLCSAYLLNKHLQPFEELVVNMPAPLPEYYEQAMVMIRALKGGAAESVELQSYVNSYNVARGNPDKLKRYENTYWFYYNFR